MGGSLSITNSQDYSSLPWIAGIPAGTSNTLSSGIFDWGTTYTSTSSSDSSSGDIYESGKDNSKKVKDLNEAYEIVQKAYVKMQEDINSAGLLKDAGKSASSDFGALGVGVMVPNCVMNPVVNGLTYLPRKAGSTFTSTKFGSAVVNNRVVSGSSNIINYGTNSMSSLYDATTPVEQSVTPQHPDVNRTNANKTKSKKRKGKRNLKGKRNRGRVNGMPRKPVTQVTTNPTSPPVTGNTTAPSVSKGSYWKRVKADMKMSSAVKNARATTPSTHWYKPNANTVINKCSSGAKWLNRAGGVTVAAGTVIEDRKKLVTAYKQGSTGQALAQTGQTAAKATGAGVGFWAGVKVGAALGTKIGCAVGSLFPGAGNAIGAAVGGFIGGLIGGFAGSYAGKKTAELAVGEDVADKIKREQLAKAQDDSKVQQSQLKSLIELAQYIEQNGGQNFDPKVTEAINLINESLASSNSKQ